jgi:hypothetical protein
MQWHALSAGEEARKAPRCVGGGEAALCQGCGTLSTQAVRGRGCRNGIAAALQGRQARGAH